MNVNEYQGIIFDLDGVVWRGKQLVPGAPEAVAALRKRGRKVAFVTNYAAESRKQQQAKLNEFGIDAKLEEVITSGYACALYLKNLGTGCRVHVMGPESLEAELREFGLETVAERADAVVVARDNGFNMQKLDAAFQNMLNPSCKFVVCAANPIHPGENGSLKPGGGVMVAALAACVGRPPDIVVGKPNTPMMELALERFSLRPAHCAVIGDILDLDIICAHHAGMESIFVLSGVGKFEDIERLQIKPTHVLHSVADLLPLL